MPQFRFSLFRLFMAVTVFCGAFAFVKMIGAPWPICPWLIGVPMAMLMLVITWDDEYAVYAALSWCGLGAILIGPVAFGATSPSRFSPTSGPTAMLIGAISGWVIGSAVRSALFRDRDTAEEEFEEEDLDEEEMVYESGVEEEAKTLSSPSNSTMNAVSDEAD